MAEIGKGKKVYTKKLSVLAEAVVAEERWSRRWFLYSGGERLCAGISFLCLFSLISIFLFMFGSISCLIYLICILSIKKVHLILVKI